MSETLKVRQAAGILNISVGLAYDLARRGQLPGCFRLGQRRFLVSRRALETFLAAGGEVGHSTSAEANAGSRNQS